MSFLTPMDEIGNQQQKENWEIHKYIKLNNTLKKWSKKKSQGKLENT